MAGEARAVLHDQSRRSGKIQCVTQNSVGALNCIRFRPPTSVMTVVTRTLLEWNEDFRVNKVAKSGNLVINQQ